MCFQMLPKLSIAGDHARSCDCKTSVAEGGTCAWNSDCSHTHSTPTTSISSRVQSQYMPRAVCLGYVCLCVRVCSVEVVDSVCDMS